MLEKRWLNPKSLVAIIWGLTIGCIIVFVDEVINLQWRAGKTIMILEPSPLLAFVTILLFSFLYLRSAELGSLCGFFAGFSYQLLKSFLTHLWPMSIAGWISLPLSYIFAGFIGGYLARKSP